MHHRAGSRNVIELHGRNDRVVCTSCGYDCSRRIIQKQIETLNSLFLEKIISQKLKDLTRVERDGIIRADGDTELGISDFSEVRNTIYICMYECMNVTIYVRVEVHMYVWKYICTCVSTYVRVYVSLYVSTYFCMYECLYVCIQVY